jgi:polar amino acid transport system substrate-binding protein
MKAIWFLTFLLSALVGTPVAANPLCPTPLRVGWDDWPPYHFQGRDGALHGFAVEVLQAVMGDLGCEIQFRPRPWRRQLQEIQIGESDIAMEAYYTEERSEFAYFSDAYSPSQVKLWIQSDHPLPGSNIGTLLEKGFLFGITKDFYYGPEFEPYRQHSNIQPVLVENLNYAKLQKGRINGFLGDWLATTWGLKQQHLEHKIKIAPITIYSAPAFFMFSKQSIKPSFVAAFNHALRQMKKRGDYQRLLDSYTRID